MKGTFSGGTAASIKATFAAAAKDLSSGGAVEKSVRPDAGIRGSEAAAGQQAAARRKEMNMWTAPFRDGDHQHPQRPPLQSADGLSPTARTLSTNEMVLTGAGEKGEATPGSSCRQCGDGAGPAARSRARGRPRKSATAVFYDLLFVALAPDGLRFGSRPGRSRSRLRIDIEDDRECAVCLLHDTPQVAGGIWTPGAAMGHPLIKRLVDSCRPDVRRRSLISAPALRSLRGHGERLMRGPACRVARRANMPHIIPSIIQKCRQWSVSMMKLSPDRSQEGREHREIGALPGHAGQRRAEIR